MRVRFASLGLAVPPAVETAADVAAKIGRSESWVVAHTGVLRRHVAKVSVERLAATAAEQALGDGPPPDLLINASVTPRQLIPDTSVFILRELGLDGVPGFSIHATCLSFLVGLNNAAALLEAGIYRRILLVSSELATVSRNFEEPESAALLGDGAAAAVLEPSAPGQESELFGWRMATFPKGAELTSLAGCGMHRHPNSEGTRPEDNLFHMDGPGVFKFAVRRVAVFLRRLLDSAGLTVEDIDLVVPHQPSGPGVRAITRFGFPEEKIQNVVHEYGNCVAASLPMALATAAASGRLRRGDIVLLLGTGAGLSIAGALVRW